MGSRVSNDSSPRRKFRPLGAETVEGPALPLKSVDDIERGNSLALGVLSVCDRVSDDRLEEELEDTTGLVVDEARDTLDTTTTRQTADSGLGNTLDVVTQNLWRSLSAIVLLASHKDCSCQLTLR